MLTLLFFDKLTVCPRRQADLADLHVSYDWISIACKHHVSRKGEDRCNKPRPYCLFIAEDGR